VHCGRKKQSRYYNQCKEVRSATASPLSNFLARFPLAATLLTRAMASPNSIFLTLSSKEFMKKLTNYELKFCGKNPRYRFWIRKMLAYVADNSEQRMMN
jgi:hypothetical protein